VITLFVVLYLPASLILKDLQVFIVSIHVNTKRYEDEYLISIRKRRASKVFADPVLKLLRKSHKSIRCTRKPLLSGLETFIKQYVSGCQGKKRSNLNKFKSITQEQGWEKDYPD